MQIVRDLAVVEARRKRQKRMAMVVCYGLTFLAAAANPIIYQVTNLAQVSYFCYKLENVYYTVLFVIKLHF